MIGGAEEGVDLERVIEEHFSALYRFILLRMPGAEEEAADIAQDSFLALAESLSAPAGAGAFEGRCSVYTWLCSVARRKIVDAYRRDLRLRRLRERELLVLSCRGEAGASPEEEVLDAAEAERVRCCLAVLPPEQRYTLILKYVEGLSTAELARILGRSDKAAESLLGRARAAFAALYEEEA
jgi:RNA polymerase sigma-70 factor, ECF subfamily